MSRILFAWELGGNLGHVMSMRALACDLRASGHNVLFALRDLRAGEVLTREGFVCVQAPTTRLNAPDLPLQPASYPEILLHYGFADAAVLAPAVRAWRDLYAQVAPDLLVFDHAPIALLAARSTGIPRVVVGTGFASPPRVSPMPSIRPWQEIPAARLQAAEQRTVDTANFVLQAIRAQRLDVFHDLFDVEENILTTLPELDHYGPRPGENYWGPISNTAGSAAPSWPHGYGRRAFVYIRPSSPAFRLLAAILRAADLRTLWFAPGLASDVIAQLESPSVKMVRTPVDISAVSRAADVAILHGGHATAAAMLLSGVPLVLLPQHIEQLLLGRNVAALGAGATFNANSSEVGLAQVLARVTYDPRYAMHAQAFAAKYANLDQTRQRAAMRARFSSLVIRANPSDGYLESDAFRAAEGAR
jgi:UDP:flavonoid glycosyltransferase YjiC (YdhE family)